MKPRQCRQCGETYQPDRSTQRVCSMHCAIAYNRALDEKKAKAKQRKQEKESRAELKRRKEALLTVNDWVKRTQRKFNRYIRVRDKDANCMSCGCPLSDRRIEAGHYMPAGRKPQLRFSTLNVWGQCSPCNQHLSGNLGNYRVGLVERIGEERVRELETNQEAAGYTVEYLKRLGEVFSRRADAFQDRRARL